MTRRQQYPNGGHYRSRWPIWRRCQWCLNEFEATRQDARLCSAKCRKAWSRALTRDMGQQNVTDIHAGRRKCVTKQGDTSPSGKRLGAQAPGGDLVVDSLNNAKEGTA